MSVPLPLPLPLPLPGPGPRIGGPPVVEGVTLAARYRPGGGGIVGGDWYDVVRLANGEVAIALGDVAGHGTTAAATMGQLRNALLGYVLDDHRPSEVLTRLNSFTMSALPSEMATALVAVLDPRTSVVRIASAGHIPPLIRSDGSTAYADVVRAPALGLPRPTDTVEGVVPLRPGATMVWFTDGLVERRDQPIDAGLERLRQVVAHGSDNVEQLCDEVMALTDTGPDADDVTVLVVRVP